MPSQTTLVYSALLPLGDLPIWMGLTVIFIVSFRKHLMKLLNWSLALWAARMPANKRDEVLNAFKVLRSDPDEKEPPCDRKTDH